MELSSAIKDVLHFEGVVEPILLGAGEDAYAFVFSDSEVIRIFPEASSDYVSELAGLYDHLRGHSFSFKCPRIYDVRTCKGIAYTIEARLPGRPMPEVCRNLDGSMRQQVLRNYLESIRELATVEMNDCPFGGLIHSTIWLTGKTWEEFLRLQLEMSLRTIGSRLAGDFPGLHRSVSRLETMIDGPMRWERKSLVHGDVYPENVLVADDGEVATVLDFGRHTLVGDPRLDIAIAIEFTEMAQGFVPEDTVFLREVSDGDPMTSNAYRAYAAILLAAECSHDVRIVEKCLGSLRETFGRF